MVTDGFGYRTALVFERENKKKNIYCIKMLGIVVYTESGLY